MGDERMSEQVEVKCDYCGGGDYAEHMEIVTIEDADETIWLCQSCFLKAKIIGIIWIILNLVVLVLCHRIIVIKYKAAYFRFTFLKALA